jgi:hypothetical protein
MDKKWQYRGKKFRQRLSTSLTVGALFTCAMNPGIEPIDVIWHRYISSVLPISVCRDMTPRFDTLSIRLPTSGLHQYVIAAPDEFHVEPNVTVQIVTSGYMRAFA